MKKVIAALMTLLFLGNAGLVLAQTPAPTTDTTVAPASTPMPKAKKHKKKKKAAMAATPVADTSTPAAK
jgi:hypothetical protein